MSWQSDYENYMYEQEQKKKLESSSYFNLTEDELVETIKKMNRSQGPDSLLFETIITKDSQKCLAPLWSHLEDTSPINRELRDAIIANFWKLTHLTYSKVKGVYNLMEEVKQETGDERPKLAEWKRVINEKGVTW